MGLGEKRAWMLSHQVAGDWQEFQHVRVQLQAEFPNHCKCKAKAKFSKTLPLRTVIGFKNTPSSKELLFSAQPPQKLSLTWNILRNV